MCFHGPFSVIKRILPTGVHRPCLLILGLDNAGKSTLTARLSEVLNGKVSLKIPSFPFIYPLESFQSKEATSQASEWSLRINTSKLQLWDINGELKNRQVWPNYYQKVKVLVSGVC